MIVLVAAVALIIVVIIVLIGVLLTVAVIVVVPSTVPAIAVVLASFLGRCVGCVYQLLFVLGVEQPGVHVLFIGASEESGVEGGNGVFVYQIAKFFVPVL